jgi:hypothetical protein
LSCGHFLHCTMHTSSIVPCLISSSDHGYSPTVPWPLLPLYHIYFLRCAAPISSKVPRLFPPLYRAISNDVLATASPPPQPTQPTLTLLGLAKVSQGVRILGTKLHLQGSQVSRLQVPCTTTLPSSVPDIRCGALDVSLFSVYIFGSISVHNWTPSVDTAERFCKVLQRPCQTQENCRAFRKDCATRIWQGTVALPVRYSCTAKFRDQTPHY